MTFAVISHDAGSSELLCAFIHQHRQDAQWHIFATPSSPMATICERLKLSFIPIGDPSEQLNAIHPDALLFGTGWQKKIERPYLHYCKEHQIPTVAFLDHWSNYRERFGYPDGGWEANLADFTAVHDEKALRLATFFGLPHPISLPNFFLLQVIGGVSNRSVTADNRLLFLSEPTDAVAKQTYGDPAYWGFTQYSALEDILKHFDLFGCAELTIRLHPSENASDFRTLLQKYPHIRIQINDAKTFELTDQLLCSKIIIGFDTMALYIAALLNKAVISYLPSTHREFFLPLPAERQLRSLSGVNPEILNPLHLNIGTFGIDFASFIHLLKGKQ